MPKSIENRVGGQNSMKNLIKNGYSLAGSHPEVSQVLLSGKTVRVKPVLVSDFSTGVENKFTLLKPVNPRKR